MNARPPLIGRAEELLRALLNFSAPADAVVSRYFRAHPGLGPRERAFVAEAVYAVLRRRRSLEHACGDGSPRALLLAAATRILGYSRRALRDSLGARDAALLDRMRGPGDVARSAAVDADLPDWLWARLVDEQGEDDAAALARGLLNAAPLDLRVNLARGTREAALDGLAGDGIEAQPTPYSPAGLRVAGKPAINRHPLFKAGLIEVQDEGSQLLAYLVAPRRGEMIADYCAGAGGKTLALAMLMRGTGRLYALDISAARLAALPARAARAGVNSIHGIAMSGPGDARLKRLSGKLDRVLVDAPCSGFGTLRRNPDLKWRHDEAAVHELAAKQAQILDAAARLVKPGGRLVYATCSILRAENEDIAAGFAATHDRFARLDCAELLAAQQIKLGGGPDLRLWPHRHGTDAFYAAAFRRRSGA